MIAGRAGRARLGEEVESLVEVLVVVVEEEEDSATVVGMLVGWAAVVVEGVCFEIVADWG